MRQHFLASFSRQAACALFGLLLLASGAAAREFTVSNISDEKGNARTPVISDTGLVAWQAYSLHEGDTPLNMRADVLSAAPNTRRADIVIWQNGKTENLTAMDDRLAGRCEQPVVSGNAVAFLAWFKQGTDLGLPFTLSIPDKTDEMKQMEQDYPTLFDPPKPSPVSTVEAEAGATTPPPEPEALAATATNGINENLQRQMWRDSGQAADIAYYNTTHGQLERLTPGNRHFCSPVVSAAGVAFQCARGWPYGYEMVAWPASATNLVQLTTNYYYVLHPDLHGNELVFQGWDGNDYEIFRYRFDTGQLEQITNNSFDDTAPVVWDGRIAWVGYPTITAEIFYWADGALRKISERTEDNTAPSIWEGQVVWQAYDDTDMEIYYFNGRRTIKLTSNTWDDLAPQIRDGLITWMSYVDNWDSEIMAFDLSDNIAVQLTNNEFEDSYPQTAGGKIVWQTIGAEGSFIQMAVPAAAP